MKNEKAAQLGERLVDFGVQAVRLSGKLPPSYAGPHIASQVLRSGASPAPHYGEARGGESRADFIHKLGVAPKEPNETQIWLKMIQRAGWLPEPELDPRLDECRQLSRMINASIRTTRRNEP